MARCTPLLISALLLCGFINIGYSNPSPFAAYDGSPGASICTGGPQLPSILSGLSRPAWSAAGVDYCVGVNSNVSLLDPSIQANLPSGATANSGSKSVTITGANVTLNGYNFPTDWVVAINSGASGTITLKNLKFTGSASATLNFIKANTAVTGIDIEYCEFNGGQVASVSSPNNASAIDLLSNTTNTTIKYNWFYGLPVDGINLSGTQTNVDGRYNLFAGLGYATGAHPDSVQQFELTTANYNFSYNTLYNPAGASAFVANEAMQMQADTSGSISNSRMQNNTITGVASGGQWSILVGNYNEGATGPTGTAVGHNYLDPNASSFGTAWGAGGSAYNGPFGTFVGNINMQTGANYEPGAISNVNIINTDVVTEVASPSTGNQTTGTPITITVTTNQLFNVVGTPTISLNSGGTASYTSGGGTSSLVFTYTVGSGDVASNLAVTGVNLPGGASIIDFNGNAFSGLNITFTGLSINASGSAPVVQAPSLGSFLVSMPATTGATAGTATATNTPTGWCFMPGCTSTDSTGDFSISSGGVITFTSTGATDYNGSVEKKAASLSLQATNGSGSGTGSNTVNAYADGSVNAPSCTIQNASLFNSYGTTGARNRGPDPTNGKQYQPPQLMPGVDYCVGYATGTTLNDPASGGLPSGCSYSSGAHSMTCSTASVTVQNLDFSLHGGTQLVLAAANITVQNNNFASTTNALDLIRLNSGANSAVIKNNVFNQNCNLPPLDAVITAVSGVSGMTIEYNFLENAGNDMISVNGGTTIEKFNYMAKDGCYSGGGGHPDYLQHASGSTSTDIVAFNTWYQPSTVVGTQGTTFGDNSVQTVGTTNEFNYNVTISTGSPSISYWVRVFLPELNASAAVSLQGNFADITGAIGGFAYPGSSNTQTTWANNTNMATAAAFSNTP